MAELSWGKPKMKIAKLDTQGAVTGSWIEIPTPIEGTTQMNVQKGQKREAKIEGGENEAVKYAANTYALEFEIRSAKGRNKPIEDVDGIISGEYALLLQPEDPTADGIQIDRAVVSVEDSYDSENGIKWKYTFDVVKPKKGEQVKYKVINLSNPSID